MFNAYSDVEEGDIVANQIVKLAAGGAYGYDDFAILYRTNAQSRIFEEALRKRGLPYRIYGGLSFYQRKEIKDIVAYFRLVVNPNDEINFPARGIGDTTLNKIIDAATRANVSLWAVLNEPLAYGLSLAKNTCAKLQGFRDLIAGFAEDALQKNAYEVGQDIVRRSGIIAEVYRDRTPENLSRQENVEELINGMHDFCASREEEGNERVSLSDYLSEISLLTDLDSEEGEGARITLMTIHSAKGLEFKNVFVVGLEENLFPSPMASGSYRQLEEERRLFYVAITRAEEHCFLSFAKSRFKYGKMEFSNPSRFLRDIDARYLKLPLGENIPASPKRVISDAPRFVKPEPPRMLRKVSLSSVSEGKPSSQAGIGVEVGQTIEHERFGIGEIIQVEGTGDNCKATVRFRHAGTKQLLLKFARFKVVS